MRQTNKPFKVLAVLFATILILIGVSSCQILDKPTRLADASAPETRSEKSLGAVLGIVRETRKKVYSQPPVEMWITPKRLVKHRASARGYDKSELKCLFEIIDRESDWNPKADNPNSTAFGLFQRLKLNPEASLQKQVRTGLDYIQHRYGTACEALKHHNKKGWY